MSKRRSAVQRVTEFFLTAPVDEARQALEIARTIVDSRLPARSQMPKRKPVRVIEPSGKTVEVA